MFINFTYIVAQLNLSWKLLSSFSVVDITASIYDATNTKNNDDNMFSIKNAII